MVRLNRFVILFGVVLGVIFSLGFVAAFEFNGTVYDINGNRLNNSVINVTVRSTTDFSVVGYNFTTSNASGWFNLSVDENETWMYEPKITHLNGSYIDYIGQALPAFPAFIFNELSGTLFYLREAGTINITAINSSGGRAIFNYQVKDQKLGYPIAENFVSLVTEAVVYVPRDRNYSIMIYPNASMPVSFDWNNLTASASYNITVTNLSHYDFNNKTLHYQFNTTLTMKRVSGFIDYGLTGWDEFTVIPYLLEPGDMIHSDFGDLPYNLSSFIAETDSHNLTDGFYNISLPGTAETSSILLFASARNGSQYIGGFRNLSLSISSAAEITAFNFSNMAGLLGVASNISLDTITGSQINITTAKHTFNFINSTNHSLSQISGHIETTVDYSSLGALEFTWMSDISQSGAATVSLPLLNSTGVKELNAFVGGGDYAPKRISPSVAQLISDINAQNQTNISIGTFNPGDIDSVLANSSITMILYTSNSSCDIPNPSGCTVGGSSSMADHNPMGAILGGGKLSFRMGTGDIAVHYVNVDMLASGPPDALFDNSPKDSGNASSFDQAVRFGSGGPTIYDYVLVSIPYTETAGSGLDDSAEVNMTMPLFYDDNWKVIWNTTANGTNAGDLAANYSHYSTYSGDWSQLMNDTVCTTAAITSAELINASSPCYIDTSANRVWIRLPHFTGGEQSITGSVVAAAGTSSTSSSGGGTSGTTNASSFWTSTFAYDALEFNERDPLTREYSAKHRVRIKIGGESHYVGVIELTETTATVNVSSTPEQATISIGESEKFDVIDDGFYDVLVLLNGIANDKANITISPIHEIVPEDAGGDDDVGDAGEDGSEEDGEEEDAGEDVGDEKSNKALVIVLIVVVIGLGFAFFLWRSWGDKSSVFDKKK